MHIYIYIHIYIHIYIYIYMYIYMYLHTYKKRNMNMDTNINLNINININMNMLAWIYRVRAGNQKCTVRSHFQITHNVCIYMYIFVYIYSYEYIYTCLYSHLDICKAAVLMKVPTSGSQSALNAPRHSLMCVGCQKCVLRNSSAAAV